MIHPLIEQGLQQSITYQEYRNLVNHLAETNDTTGNEKTVALINYTKLNARRMKRWEKTLKVNDKTRKLISEFNQSITWLVITESWCGDAAHVLPVVNVLAALNANIELRIVLRDEHPELMDMFLTNGARAIAKLIMIDNEAEAVVDTFGPRPSEATKMVNNFKAEHGRLTPGFKEDLQLWYNRNKGQNIIDDITQILCKYQPEVCT